MLMAYVWKKPLLKSIQRQISNCYWDVLDFTSVLHLVHGLTFRVPIVGFDANMFFSPFKAPLGAQILHFKSLSTKRGHFVKLCGTGLCGWPLLCGPSWQFAHMLDSLVRVHRPTINSSRWKPNL